MSIVIQVEPELSSQAEAVFKQLGISMNEVVDSVLRYVVVRKKLPEDLIMPPIPCIDDMTEEDLITAFEEGINDIEAGRFYTEEEVRTILEEDDDEPF